MCQTCSGRSTQCGRSPPAPGRLGRCRWSTGPRRRLIFRSTCRLWVATFTPSPPIRCWGGPGSVSSTVGGPRSAGSAPRGAAASGSRGGWGSWGRGAPACPCTSPPRRSRRSPAPSPVSSPCCRMHEPRDPFRSPRFGQIATFMLLPHVREAAGLDVALVGIPYDGGTSYRAGARFGPRAIREQSSLIRTLHPLLKVHPFERLRGADYGDIDAVPISIERTLEP